MILFLAWNHEAWIGGRRVATANPWQWYGRISGEIPYVDDYWYSVDSDHGFLCLIEWGAGGYPDGTLGDEHCDATNIPWHLCETDMLY